MENMPRYSRPASAARFISDPQRLASVNVHVADANPRVRTGRQISGPLSRIMKNLKSSRYVAAPAAPLRERRVRERPRRLNPTAINADLRGGRAAMTAVKYRSTARGSFRLIALNDIPNDTRISEYGRINRYARAPSARSIPARGVNTGGLPRLSVLESRSSIEFLSDQLPAVEDHSSIVRVHIRALDRSRDASAQE